MNATYAISERAFSQILPSWPYHFLGETRRANFENSHLMKTALALLFLLPMTQTQMYFVHDGNYLHGCR